MLPDCVVFVEQLGVSFDLNPDALEYLLEKDLRHLCDEVLVTGPLRFVEISCLGIQYLLDTEQEDFVHVVDQELVVGVVHT